MEDLRVDPDKTELEAVMAAYNNVIKAQGQLLHANSLVDDGSNRSLDYQDAIKGAEHVASRQIGPLLDGANDESEEDSPDDESPE